jgi:limonene-1,2-epoxide hydrolase
MDAALPAVISEFLAAVNAREASRARACFTEEAAYHFLMPQPPVVGGGAIEAAFAKVLGECSDVQWEVVTAAVSGDLVFLERVDRFYYDGGEVAIECLGVFEIDGGLIRNARDYADYSTWQQRKAAVRG